MNSNDTLAWYPAQLPPVKIVLGNAIIEVTKQGRPINARTLLDYLHSVQGRPQRKRERAILQTAISVLRDSQREHGRD